MPPLTDEQIKRFLQVCVSRAGAEELLMPREMIRDYLSLLNILRDNKDLHFDDIMKDFESKPQETEAQYVQSGSEEKEKKPKISLFDLEI